LDLLVRAGSVLHESLDYQITLQRVGDLLVPKLADWFVIHLIEDGEVQPVLVLHKDPAMVKLVRDLQDLYPPDPEAPNGVYQVLRTGVSDMMAEIPDALLREAARDEKHLDIILRLGLISYICVPLSTHGVTLGTLSLVSAESGLRYDSDDLHLAEELGRRIARAVENARLFRASELARAQLERSTRVKDEFLGIVAHELRTPITTIFGSSQLVRQRWKTLDESSLLQLVEGIERASRDMVQLVESLLVLARVEVEETVTTAAADPSLMADRAVAALNDQNPERLVNVNATPGMLVDCVPTYVEQILGNLLGNADKYSPAEEPIDLVVTSHGDEVRFVVRDRGQGVDPDELPILFESFYRSPKVESLPGKGLGLAVCRRLAEAQGGRVWARLPDDGGLEVGFGLPRTQAAEGVA
jgi:K+-sensing histidine kinase KdpD